MYNILTMSTQQALMAAKENNTVISEEDFGWFWRQATRAEMNVIPYKVTYGEAYFELPGQDRTYYRDNMLAVCNVLQAWALSDKCELSARSKRNLVRIYQWLCEEQTESRTQIVKAVRMDGSGGWSNTGISHVLVLIDKNENEVDITWTGANPTWDALADFLINDKDIQSLVMKAAQYPRRRKIYWKNNSGYSGRWTKTLYEADPNAPSWAPTAGSHKVFQLDVSCFDKVSCIGGSKSTAYRIKAEDLMELFISEIGEIETLSDLIGGLHTIRKHGVPTRHGYGWWYYEKHCRHWEDVELIERSGSRGIRRESRR